MNNPILVTGATGNVGSRVVAELLASRGAAPDPGPRPERVPESWLDPATGVQIAVGDFDGPGQPGRGAARAYAGCS